MKKIRLYVKNTTILEEPIYVICYEENDEEVARCYSNIAAEVIRRELENFLNK